MANRFRKVYIVCEGNSIFGNLTAISIHKYRDHAEFQCERMKKKALAEKDQYEHEKKPLPKFKVHGFYLVHEDIFRD